MSIELQDEHGHKIEPIENLRNGNAGVPLDKDKIKLYIVKYRGNLTKVAQALGCARQSIARIARTDSTIKQLIEDTRESVIDEVEDSFTKRAIAGDTTASIFFLKTRGRERGYDQDFRADIEAVTRAALSYAINKSRNPAES